MHKILRLPLLAIALAMPAIAPSAGLQIQPGQWAFTGRVVSAEIPGAPPAVRDMITKRPQTHSMCLTPEQAARDPRSVFQSSKGRCSYAKFDMALGRLSSVMTCQGGTGGQGAMTITTNGSYTASSYRTRSVMAGSGPRGMKMVVEGAGKRIGPCK